MLCSQNSGKYLSGKWHRDRQRAIRNSDQFTAAQLSFLEIDTTTLPGPLGELDDYEETMKIRPYPVDILDDRRYVRWNKLPEVSD